MVEADTTRPSRTGLDRDFEPSVPMDVSAPMAPVLEDYHPCLSMLILQQWICKTKLAY